MTVGSAATPNAEPAERIAAAVLGITGVEGLHAGMFGEVGTYLPGRRIGGVRVADDAIDIHLVLRFGAAVRPTAAAVRSAIGLLYPDRPVNVTVEDIAPPGERS